MPLSGEFSLYFHVPFCTRKCDYCHFYVIPNEERFKETYMRALHLEWMQKKPQMENLRLVSIYFGGGTPSLLGPERIGAILDWICPDAGVEVTLEANPEHVTYSLMQNYQKAGINRISLGVQTFDASLLAILGREHSLEQSKQAVQATYSAGIENISIDLMYDIPTQTLQSWENTLSEALLLPIKHLSLYNLSIEPHTVFYKHRSRLRPQLPDQATSLSMLTHAIESLEMAHLKRYEISAFAASNTISHHNSGYWTFRPFLGLGPSAFSYWEGSRFRNIANLARYSKRLTSGLNAIDFSETLLPQEQLHERLAVGLRLIEGVLLPSLPFKTMETLKVFEARGWLVFEKERIRLTPEGLLFHDTIAEEIIGS